RFAAYDYLNAVKGIGIEHPRRLDEDVEALVVLQSAEHHDTPEPRSPVLGARSAQVQGAMRPGMDPAGIDPLFAKRLASGIGMNNQRIDEVQDLFQPVDLHPIHGLAIER